MSCFGRRRRLRIFRIIRIAGMYLGYDPISKQSKVLCMTWSRDEKPNTHQVLTLESGKRLWRTIEFKFHFSQYGRIRGEVCINGVLYFGDGSVQSSVVVCFDVRSEKFSFVNTDKGMDVEESPLTLFNHKGKLGAHQDVTFMGNDNEFVLWVLEDAGNHRWSKHVYVLPYSVDEIVADYDFVGMTGTGEIVWSSFYLPGSFYVVFYNLERDTLTSVNIKGFEEFNHHRVTTVKTFLDYVENMKFM